MPRLSSPKKSAVKKTPPAKAARALKVGAPVPDFSMSATLIGSANRASLKGKPFVLYFYPKDDTSGCTAEACDSGIRCRISRSWACR